MTRIAFSVRPYAVPTRISRYSAVEAYAEYYRHPAENVVPFLDGKPIRVLDA